MHFTCPLAIYVAYVAFWLSTCLIEKLGSEEEGGGWAGGWCLLSGELMGAGRQTEPRCQHSFSSEKQL